tara:strand:- start:6800 stop:7867 length:1068 start_codon:yes stop_codon:yes gene_type:complete
MKKSLLVSAIAIASLTSTQQAAAEYDYYATYGAGHTDHEITNDYFYDGDYARHSYTLEAALGYMLSDDIAIEANLVIPSFVQEDRTDVTQFRLSGLYFFGDDALKPYLTAAAGYENNSADGADDLDGTILSAGLGLQYDFATRWFARAEARLDDLVNEDLEQMTYLLEVGYRFGGASDKGYSYSDAATPAPVAPASKPTAVAPTVAAPVTIVKDDDKDGINNAADKCPATPSGVNVDATGCPAFSGGLKGVKFESGSARLTPASQTILDAAATELSRYPDLNIEIGAYTDDRGSDALNQNLSQKRAESVRSYLLGKGIATDKLTAKGYGEASPIASNDTAEGRAENRRVEFVILK